MSRRTATDVVLVDAGRSVVIPDGPGLPGTPLNTLGGVIEAVLERTGLEVSEVDALFLAEPGGDLAGELGVLPTTSTPNSAVGLEQAVTAVRANPDLVVVVAAGDWVTDADRRTAPAGTNWLRRAASSVAYRAQVGKEDVRNWIRSSHARSAECSRAGDFAREIVATTPGHRADTLIALHHPETVPARGASAVIVTGRGRAGELGLPCRAVLATVCCAQAAVEAGVEPLDRQAFDALLAPCGIDSAHLDQLEVPELDPVTPLAWIKATGISRYLVNPRGGDLGFGRLVRSGPLRSLVSMVNSLEATGGRSGVVLADDGGRTVALVLSVEDIGESWADVRLAG